MASRTSGITQMRRVADLALLNRFHSRHGATDISPTGMAAASHFDDWIPNFGIQDHMAHNEQTMELFSVDYSLTSGFFTPGDKPGHGVDIDKTLVARILYKRACLPVNRLEDGTLRNW